VKGSGPGGGRIVKKDVESYQPEAAPAARPSAPQAAAPLAPAAIAGSGIGPAAVRPDVEVIVISRLRQRIGQRMVESKSMCRTSTCDAIDVTALLDLRKQLNASARTRSKDQRQRPDRQGNGARAARLPEPEFALLWR
jgi:pyruvate/2-oxoglutarate dehydrogenase complex dihydrolipoamide acyltransferase (E2) component